MSWLVPRQELTAEQIRAVEGPRNWASLYQQQPTPDEGGYFERQYFAYYDEAPPLEHMRLYGASDYAVSEDHGDFTVHLVVGVAPDSSIYVLDLWRAQANTLTWIETLFALVQKYRRKDGTNHIQVWAEEEDQIKKAIGPIVNKLMAERRCWFSRFQLPTQGGARDGAGKAKQMKITPEERSTAVRAAKILGLNVCGVDMLRSNHGPVVMEVNSTPGLEGIESATGTDIAGLIIEFLEKNAAPNKTKTRGEG